ncbi:alpha/beta hydrolase [Azospirillum sp. A29]|jgi:pimeloyl-ACP methyl ester carboxylesterase|uniref:alpha/beta fold hydrolase n=1 Tax=Azospirillum sp. A29 TaxID=3160606 RepID=UPI00366FCA85
MLGLAGAAAVGVVAGPAIGATTSQTGGQAAGPSAMPQGFSVRSSDGTVLTGDAQGDPQAPEILFVHGLRQSRLSWDRQFADPALAGFRLVRFDLRGHGDSDKPASPDAYRDADRWAEDLAAVIAGTGLRRPVLVGWSLGGYVVGAYLRAYGGAAVAGINLVDAVTKLSRDLLTPLAGTFARSTSSHDLAERTAATTDFLSACFYQPPTGIDLQRMLVVNGMTARAVNEGFTGTQTTDLEPAFQAFTGPILLTHGVHDRLVRVEMSERIKALHPRSHLSLYPDSGHSPFYEEPARYGRELSAFVTTIVKG